MKDFLLSRADRSPGRRDTATVALTEERGDTFFDALSSETSRRLFQRLHERPSTPSELAEELDTSRQNVHYHLEKLAAADLVEPIDTVYSSRGREMSVYAPTHEAVVLVSGGESTVDRVRSVLSRFLGGLAVLLVASLLLQAAVVGLPDLADHGGPTGGSDGDADGPAAGPTPTAADPAVERGDTAGDDAEATAGGTPTPDDDAGATDGETPAPDAAEPTGTAAAETAAAGGDGGDGGAATRTAAPAGTERPRTADATRTADGNRSTPTASGPGGSPVGYFLAGGVFALGVSAVWQYRR